MLRHEASFDSKSPTFRSKSETMFKAELRVFGERRGSGSRTTDCPFGVPFVMDEDLGEVTEAVAVVDVTPDDRTGLPADGRCDLLMAEEDEDGAGDFVNECRTLLLLRLLL